MKDINKIRSEVMTLAWNIVKRDGISVSLAMKEAWCEVKESLKPKEESNWTLNSLKNTLMSISQGFDQTCKILPVWSKIMQKGDEVGHFASEIVEKVVLSNRNRGISEKQAWAVAYFAKDAGII